MRQIIERFRVYFTLLITVAAIVIAGGVGYLVGYLLFTTSINDLEDQVSNLLDQVTSLEIDFSAQETELSTMEGLISTLEDTVSTLEDTVSGQQDTILSQEQQITLWEIQVASLQEQLNQSQLQLTTTDEQLSSLQEQLDTVIVTHRYTWYYLLETRRLDLSVSLLDYLESKGRTRPTDWSSYVDMAMDTRDDYYIYQVVSVLDEPYSDGLMNETQRIDYMITFIRSMPYISNNIAAPYDGIPLYPLETLFERGGDSEETSILVASLLYRMGVDVALLVFEDTKHIAVGIAIPGDHGLYFEYNGKKYFYQETTQLGWPLGVIPSFFQGEVPQVFPLNE